MNNQFFVIDPVNLTPEQIENELSQVLTELEAQNPDRKMYHTPAEYGRTPMHIQSESSVIFNKEHGGVGTGYYENKRGKRSKGTGGIQNGVNTLHSNSTRKKALASCHMDMVYYSKEETFLLANSQGGVMYRVVSELFGVLYTNDKESVMVILTTMDQHADVFEIGEGLIMDVHEGRADIIYAAN